MFFKFDKALAGRKLILFGTGFTAAKIITQYLEDYEISYICDNDPSKWGTIFMGYEVRSPESLCNEDPDNTLVLHEAAVHQQLRHMGFDSKPFSDFNSFDYNLGIRDIKDILKENYSIICQNDDKIKQSLSLFHDEKSIYIFNKVIEKLKDGHTFFGDICENNQYFQKDIFRNSMTENEVYIDAGVLNGNTIIDFIEFVNNKYDKIYGFEPDQISFGRCLKAFRYSRMIELHPYALHKEDTELIFNTANTGASRAIDSSNPRYKTIEYNNILRKVRAVKLDDVVPDKVTFIKMDIEGGELDALIGASNIIKTYRPKLAISMYHKASDLWELPMYIKELVPEYKLYLRHHSQYLCETVLYATI